MPVIDLENLGVSAGGSLLVKHVVGELVPGERVEVRGRHPELALHLMAWCRAEGHELDHDGGRLFLTVGTAHRARWERATRAGSPSRPDAHADPTWGLAARGALVESGGPPLSVAWADRDLVWADIAPKLYASANANQWDPATAVAWDAPTKAPAVVEDAIVQIMTYLIENEQAALVIPSRLLSRLHPHFHEVMQLLASQVADEARHVEIFTRRALLNRDNLGLSTVSGRASLQSLVGEHDFTMASFLLSVMGEGTFLDLLRFINEHAPDAATADVTRLAAGDEARHVAFGVAHTAHVAKADPAFLGRLRAAVEQRHAVLADTAGLNAEVLESLVLLAAGSWHPTAIARGWDEVQNLLRTMDEGRRRRLAFIGFPDDEATEISSLHTQNFM